MNYSEQNAQNILPQFSEITSRTHITTSNYISTGNNHPQVNQNAVYTTAANSNNAKQILVSEIFLFILLLIITVYYVIVLLIFLVLINLKMLFTDQLANKILKYSNQLD